tara:strand:- start:5843 stop:6820 length:978 start_codon:yes stop_codon:yes gene_type:complete
MNPMHLKDEKSPKVLVTGANGFIGRALCQKLVRNSITHFRLFRPNYKKNDSKEQTPSNIVFGDLLDLPSLRAACRNVDIIIHAAGVAHVFEAGRKSGRNINKDGTSLLLRAALEEGVKRFIYVSSSLADRKRNDSVYGKDKLAAESQILNAAYTKKIEAIILRPVNVYGVGMKGNLLNFARLINTGFMPRLPRLGGKFSLVSANDVATALTLAIDCKLSDPQVLTLTDGHSYTVNEIEVKLRKANNLKLPWVKLPATLLFLSFIMIIILTKLRLLNSSISLRTYKNLTHASESSNLKAKEILGFKPSTTFYEMLPEITDTIRNKS